MSLIHTYKCLNCGIEVTKKNTKQKYCSNKCQGIYQRNQKIKKGIASAISLKSYLIEKRGSECYVCGITEWNNKKLVMELEHKDGNSSNNNLKNLELICPNCHSQTSTYKGANIGQGRHYRKLRYRQGKSY